MRAMCVAVAVILSTVPAVPRAQTGGLSRSEIAEAIKFGESQEPRAYLLRHAGRPDNPTVVGAVYTPFLRVAFLARAAADRGEHLAVDQIGSRLTAPVIYIAFRWYGQPSPAEPQVVMLPVAPRAPQYVPFTKLDERKGAVRPIWSSRGIGALDTFGATPPYGDVALVAAFPMAALEPGRPFVIFKDVGIPGEIGSGRVIATGVVRSADVLAWR